VRKTEQKVFAHIKQFNLINKNEKIIVALSGGADSVFLLYLLSKYKKKFSIELSAVHINHNLRTESGMDVTFCTGLCEKLRIPLYTLSVDVKSFAANNKKSIEEAGRDLRYSEFEKLRESLNYDKIATAHNAGDNAETVLLNLVKGTGLKGISGIPPVRNNIIRPILSVTKEEILDYLAKADISHVIDPSNQSRDYERNYIRHDIIPLLKKLNPALEASLLNSAQIFRNYSEFITSEINKLADKFSFTPDGLFIDPNKWEKELRGAVVKELIEKHLNVKLPYDKIIEIINLSNEKVGKMIEIPGNISAYKERGGIRILEKTDSEIEEIDIFPGEVKKVGNLYLEIMEKTFKEVKFEGGNQEFIDADLIRGSFTIRKWLPGDKFIPLGGKGSKKISDFLNDLKVDSNKKKNCLVLTNLDRIVWVVGFRIDNRYKITNNTERVLSLCTRSSLSL
jgi:tRNA(Ile)-lysidine synthase